MTAQQETAVDRASKLYAILKGCAERNETCPANTVMAERFGVKPNSVVSYYSYLEANGMIEIERVGRYKRRIKITATGKSTL